MICKSASNVVLFQCPLVSSSIAKFFLFPFVFLFVFVLQSKHSLDVTLHIEIHKICLFVYLHFVIALCFNTIQSLSPNITLRLTQIEVVHSYIKVIAYICRFFTCTIVSFNSMPYV